MRRAICSSLLTLTLVAPAAADVTIKQTTGGKGLGMSGSASGTTYIKGGKMRTEMVNGDKTLVSIFDLDAQKMYSFDTKKKEAEVWSLGELQAQMAKGADVSAMKASITPNNQTKQVGGKTAAGYDMQVSVPAAMGGNPDMKMTVLLTGPVWIVKDAPGSADWARFYKIAAEKGFIFGDPRAVKASPGQARAMTEMYNQMASIGGIAYETETSIKIEGSGPMAGLMSKMGGVTMTTSVTEVSAAALGDDLFAVPAGYALKERK